MTHALLIVDVQNDFTEGGALGVAGGAAVARAVSTLLEREGHRYGVIAASRDWHRPDHDNGGHIALEAEPDFVDTWPIHCIAGTTGADYHPELDVTPIGVHVRKGDGIPSYSAFEGVGEDGGDLASAFRAAGVTHIDVVGIATDHCVRASALDAKREGFDVRVLADHTAAVSPDRVAEVVAELERAGITVEGEPLTASN